MLEALITELKVIEDPRCEWKVEHRLIDVQTSRGVQQERGQTARCGLLARSAADLERSLPGLDHWHTQLGAQDAELILGGGAVRIGRGENRMLPWSPISMTTVGGAEAMARR